MTRGKLWIATAIIVVIAVGVVLAATRDDGPTPAGGSNKGSGLDQQVTPRRAFLRDACGLPPQWVKLIHRGWVPGSSRDFDLVLVPKPPNYIGTVIDASHSGPYGFLQKVPLLFYGRGFIKPLGHTTLGREVTLVDVAPTLAELLAFEWPERGGQPLTEILTETDSRPELIVTVVVDGGGWNVLDYWPDAWPNLRRLMEAGTTIDDAIVGSSPSITPSVHTNISTGAYPRVHGVTGITIRHDDGRLSGAFSTEARLTNAAATRPDSSLRIPTIADLWDLANNNVPEVGMFATGNYPLGLMGYGASYEGGDHDILGLTESDSWVTNPDFFSLPEYVSTELAGPQAELEAVDRRDGEADGKWQGHDLRPLDATPALAPWQNRVMKAVLDREGFGDDELTDLFFINYKSPDYAGHQWNMTAPEQEDVIRSVDTALGALVDWLDGNVGEDDYVLLVTADHGQTPITGAGWPISRSETIGDVAARFDKLDNKRGLVQSTSAVSLFLNRAELKANNVRPEEVASFLSRYTIGQNLADGSEVPSGFEDRLDERIFSAAFPGRKLPKIVACTGALKN